MKSEHFKMFAFLCAILVQPGLSGNPFVMTKHEE